MVTIKTVETVHVALPTRRVHRWTGLTEPIGSYVLVRMTGDDGTIGWGESPALKDWGGDWGRYFGETPDTTMLVVGRYLAPSVPGVEAANAVELHRRMDAAIKGYPYAKASVEMAAYDLAGRSLGLPVWALLGGRARDRVPVTHSIGLLPIEEAAAECVQVVKEGIRTIKLKVGVEPARDVEIVHRVREAVGPDVDLCVDANQGWASPREAIRMLQAMEPCRLKYAEQPVEGIAAMAEVARAIATPVMADESAWTAHDVLEIIERGAADIVSIYTTKPGGLFRALEVAAVVRAAGLRCNVNGSVETGIGNLANVHLAAAAPAVTLSCVVPISTPAEAQHGQLAGIYYTDDLIARAFEFRDGAIVVPEGPGMGINADPDKIARYTVKAA
ncbi:MAG TPA: enolase C-terminal domain-like protein [Methylomirabilota bacterium]|nr:enolase C-terminal domain-like protein [Methylomirabilota bacterium]